MVGVVVMGSYRKKQSSPSLLRYDTVLLLIHGISISLFTIIN